MKIIIFCLITVILVSSVFISSEALSDKKQTVSSQYKCKGKALCINGTVTKIIDGDTLWVKEIVDGIKKYKIRLSLTSTPELYDKKGVKIKEGFEAYNFLKNLCPAGSNVLVDEDDGQMGGSYDRMLGKVICNGKNINAELLSSKHVKISTKFCSKSEFSGEVWAQKYGCETKTQLKQQIPKESGTPTPTKETKCDPSYPDVCIPPYPPDLDCGDISYKNFRVLPPDPHGFDRDKDGMGCEK